MHGEEGSLDHRDHVAQLEGERLPRRVRKGELEGRRPIGENKKTMERLCGSRSEYARG